MTTRSHGSLFAAALVALPLALAGCSVEDETEPEATESAADTAPHTATRSYEPREAVTPIAGYDRFDPERIEAERYDPGWREFAAGDRGLRTSSTAATAATDSRSGDDNPVLARLRREPPPAASERTGDGAEGDTSREGSAGGQGAAETWESISPDALDGEPRFPIDTEGGGPTVLRVQWLLDRARFSPGVIDGRWGKNTEKAVYWLQDSMGIDPTGTVDRALYDRLEAAVGESSPLREHRLTSADLEGPFVEIPEETAPKAELDCLCYTSVEEKLAEMFHTTPELLAQLNQDVELAGLASGDTLWVPNVEVVEPGEAGGGGTEAKVARIVISKGGFYLHALGEQGNVLYHFPTTVGTEYDPSPDGTLTVEGVGWKPDFHYQPKLFSDVPDTEEDLLLPPGPNSPVGVVWMSLSKENYGIHGTAEPATIGYTTSHGCIRLTNWDAIFLGHRVEPGTPVEFRE